MKIVHINTYDGNGGAGRACLRLNKALTDAGEESSLYVNYKFGANALIGTFSAGLISKGLAVFGILAERFISSLRAKKLKIPFSIPVWGKDISKRKALRDADIIHLHWINHAFLRPRDLARLRRLNKPIVWTFHDSNAFTGGCHVRYACDHFEHECGNCPLLEKSHPRDDSHRIWKAKYKAYQQLIFTVVAPSRWMEKSVKRSGLLSSININNIPNTLDTTVFCPHNKLASRARLGLSEDKFIMMSGFMPSRKDLHKGTPYLLEAIEHIISKNRIDPEEIELIVFGNRDEKNLPEFSVKTIFLGTIAEDEKLAICYSAADVFITPSLEDNLPNTVMESLACGTPVVAFTTGGIPDMVVHKQNGYLAEYKSAEDLAEGILWIYNNQNREALNKQARLTVEQNFSEAVIAEKHLTLYRRLLNEGNHG